MAGGSRFPALTTRYDFKTADNKGLLQLHGLVHENRVAPKDSTSEEKFGWGVGHDHVLIVFIYLACGTPPSLHLHEIDLLVKQEKAPLTYFMSKEL